MLSVWQSHLMLALVLFLATPSRGKRRGVQLAILGITVALTWIPIEQVPLAIFVRTLTDDLSIALLVLLGAHTGARLQLVPLPFAQRRDALWLFAALGLLLYPASLGLSYLDPYRWGYAPGVLLMVLAILTMLLVLRRCWLAVAMLTLATAAYALRPEGTTNYWNVLLDPLLVLYALGWSLAQGLGSLWRRLAPMRAARPSASSPAVAETDK